MNKRKIKIWSILSALVLLGGTIGVIQIVYNLPKTESVSETPPPIVIPPEPEVPKTIIQTDLFKFDYSNNTLLGWCDDLVTKPTEVVIPKQISGYDVLHIGEKAFAGQLGWDPDKPEGKLAKVTINEGLLSIGNNSFSRNMLKFIHLPDSIISIGYLAFDWNKITNFTWPKNVTEIPYGVFQNCFIVDLDFSTIAPNITSIGDYAFSSCKIKNLVLPEGLIKVEGEAFQGNYIEEIIIPDSVTSIGGAAFSLQEGSTTKIVIGKNVKTIEGSLNSNIRGAFEGVARKKENGNTPLEIVIPPSVESLGENAFANNDAITKVSFSPDTKITIGEGAFNNCSLTELHINKNMTLKDYAFANNSFSKLSMAPDFPFTYREDVPTDIEDYQPLLGMYLFENSYNFALTTDLDFPKILIKYTGQWKYRLGWTYETYVRHNS